MEKRLIGSGCRLRVSWVGRRMGVSDKGGDRRREGTVLEENVGHLLVTIGDFVA